MNHALPTTVLRDRAAARVLRRLVLLAALLLLAGPATPLHAQTRTAELDAVLERLHADGLFTGALLIGRDGAVVYRRALGEHAGRPMTPRTPLPLASVTKPISATAALSMVEDGLLALDAPVGRYIEGWPYPDVTVRHLLNQTSGLHFLTAINAHADTTQPVRNADVLALIAEHRPGLGAPPGDVFRYDNANFVTLASVLEAAGGASYADVLRERVFAPAGMDSAHVRPDDETGASWLRWLGGGGIVASAEDLLAFDGALRGGVLLSPAMLDASTRRPTLADGTLSRYGLGWFVYEEPAPMMGHFGDGVRAKTALMRERNSGTTYVLVMPGDAIHRTDILRAVIALWHGEPYTLPTKRPVADVAEDVLRRYVGVYESGMGRLHITLEDGQLHLEPEGAGGSEPLIPASDTVFYFGHQDLSWEFVRDETGAVTGLMLEGHPETLGKKVE